MSGKRKCGGYEIRDEGHVNQPDFDLHAADFNQMSMFGAVLKTMYMFEETDTLGRLKERCGVQFVPDLADDVFYFDV